MPTNILRKRGTAVSAKDAPATSRKGRGGPARIVEITIGPHTFTAALNASAAADRIWAALPLFSSAETWGQAIHFEVPVESGREAGATLKAAKGALYYWSDEHRVIFAFGATPLSRDGEMRLPVPCTAWATTDADLGIFTGTTPGQKVGLVRK